LTDRREAKMPASRLFFFPSLFKPPFPLRWVHSAILVPAYLFVRPTICCAHWAKFAPTYRAYRIPTNLRYKWQQTGPPFSRSYIYARLLISRYVYSYPQSGQKQWCRLPRWKKIAGSAYYPGDKHNH